MLRKPLYKVSIWASVADLVAVERTLLEKSIAFVFGKKAIYQKYSLDESFGALKKAGVDGIELLVNYKSTDQNIQDVLKISKKYDLPVQTLHQSLETLTNINKEEIIRLCDIAALFHAKVITLHSVALNKKLFDTSFIASLKKLETKYNIRFGIENMPQSPLSFGKEYTYNVRQFSKTVTNAGLSMTLDTTHVGQVGSDILKFFTENKDRIVCIHLSDYQKHWLNSLLQLQNYTHLPLLKGSLPIKKFLKLLQQSNYDGFITMEIKGSLEDLCQSATIIKTIY